MLKLKNNDLVTREFLKQKNKQKRM